MIFHNDKCTIIRRLSQTVDNHLSFEEKIIYKDVPCHLSFNSLNATNQTDSKAYNQLSFKLYINSHLNIDIQLNDIVQGVTEKGQAFKLYAGGIAKYPLTTQVTLEREKIV